MHIFTPFPSSFFPENMQNRKLCDLVLSEEEVQYLREAIEEHYYYEFVVDDIPVRDFIGHLEESGFVPHTHKVYLWTHQHFNIYYNENKVGSQRWTVGCLFPWVK